MPHVLWSTCCSSSTVRTRGGKLFGIRRWLLASVEDLPGSSRYLANSSQSSWRVHQYLKKRDYHRWRLPAANILHSQSPSCWHPDEPTHRKEITLSLEVIEVYPRNIKRNCHWLYFSFCSSFQDTTVWKCPQSSIDYFALLAKRCLQFGLNSGSTSFYCALLSESLCFLIKDL